MSEEFVIKPAGKFSFRLGELWQHKELVYFFAWRDVKVKYKQTYLGVMWVLLQPLLMMVVYTVLFRKILNAESDQISYPLFVYSGLLIWTFFSSSLTSTSDSMLTNASIIKKIYFPRLIIPISSTLTCLFDLFISMILFIVLMVMFGNGINFGYYLFLFPISLTLTLLTSIGLGTFLAALNIKYRDFRYILPFLIQFMFFFSPIVYSGQEATRKFEYYAWIQMLNPVSMAIELMRLPLTGVLPDWGKVVSSFGVALLIFLLGLYRFRKTEAYFADLA